MPKSEDRRSPEHTGDDEFSPEYLAVLVVCGGEVRDSDWAVLPEALVTRHFGSPALPSDDAASHRRSR